MIDLASESVLTLSAAAREVPSLSGRGVHVSTVWRWALRGCRGVRLETLMVGGVRYTSREALQRFAERLTAAADGTRPAPAPTSRQRQRAIEQAERELARAGL